MKAMLVLLLCVLSISLPASGRILQASSAAPSAVNFVTALKSAKTKADLSGLIKALEATGISNEKTLFDKIVPGGYTSSSPPATNWTILAPSTAILTKLMDIVNKKVADSKSTIEKEYGAAFLPKVLSNHFILGETTTSADMIDSPAALPGPAGVLYTALPYTDIAVYLDPPGGKPSKDPSQISLITAPNGHLPEPLVLGPLARARLITPDITAGPGIIVHVIDNIMLPPMDLFKDAGVDARMVTNIQDALTRATGKAPLPSTNWPNN